MNVKRLGGAVAENFLGISLRISDAVAAVGIITDFNTNERSLVHPVSM